MYQTKIVNPENPSEFIETDWQMPGEQFILDRNPPSLKQPKLKLWHDDVRRPPNGSWTWVRSNAEAQLLLKYANITEISLDHDLGGSDIPDEDLDEGTDFDYMQLTGTETGFDLVQWMCEHDCVPDFVRIHSMNAPAAKRMCHEIEFHWYNEQLSNDPIIEMRPFEASERS